MSVEVLPLGKALDQRFLRQFTNIKHLYVLSSGRSANETCATAT